MRIWPMLALVTLLSTQADAADIPLDDAGFTAYIQAKLQLYTRRPVRSEAPLTVTVDASTRAGMTFDVRVLHKRCVAKPDACDDAVYHYVQQTVDGLNSAEQPAALPPPVPATLPSDRDDFMHDLAARASALAPQASFVPDGANLVVTRPGGRAFKADMQGPFNNCRAAGFQCASMIGAYMVRLRDLLDIPDRDQLRAAPGFERSCEVIASVGNSISCRIRPSPAPLVGFFRRAFSNLAEYCFKQTPHGVVPMINADRADLGLSLDEALDACAADTHKALAPLSMQLGPGAAVIRVDAPWASAYVFFPDDWSSFAARAGGHFLVAVPARDVLLVIRGDDEAAQRTLAAATLDAATHSPFGISTDIYRWTGGGFTLGTDTSTMTGGPPRVVDAMPRVP